jgi:uncharacterized protein YdeI (YjbR/CyaY-like superfamily)
MAPNPAEPRFFATPEDFRAWLEENHATAGELWVGFHKKGTGRPSITWPESVDEALCVGWIDGVRRSLGEESYMIRFTPRRPGSIWSAVNVGRVEALSAEGRMRPAGLAAFARRSEAKTAIYTHEQPQAAVLDPELEREFRARAAAWEWFQGQAPSYRKRLLGWVMGAKGEETRRRRLAKLVEESAAGRRM